jgi:hypothetical protein
MTHARVPNNELLKPVANVMGGCTLETSVRADSGQWFRTGSELALNEAVRFSSTRVKSLKMETWDTRAASRFGPPTCIWPCVGRVPTRSAPTSSWGGRGPLTGRNGSFPPASEREARMDDPMIRSRLGRIKERDLWGSRSQARAPSFFSSSICSFHSVMPFARFKIAPVIIRA